MGLLRHFKGKQNGQAAVEMAFLLPVLILIFLVILEMGRVLDAWIVATNAAREGARYAAYGEPATMVRSKVGAYLTKGLAGRGDVITPTPAEIAIVNAQGTPGSAVKVVVPLRVHIYAPWTTDLGFPNPFTVQGAVTMRIQ